MPEHTTQATNTVRRWAVRLGAAYLVVVLAVWGALHFGADEAALPTLLLFGPRWIVALPLLVLVPLAIWARSRWLGGFTLIAVVVVAGPIMGGTIDVESVIRSDPPALLRLRVVTWNMGGAKSPEAFRRFLEQHNPDVVVLQETTDWPDTKDFPPGWHVEAAGNQRIASRFQLRRDGELTPTQLGAPGRGLRCVLTTPDGEVTVVNLHLPTVRPGIEGAIGTRFSDLSELRQVIETRRIASRVARTWVGSPDTPVIVAGDFNMPVESRIYRGDWGTFRNAYSKAGCGWGTTKQTRWFGTRIDHVLYTSPGHCYAAEVGPDLGSDHRPLVADLGWPDGFQ